MMEWLDGRGALSTPIFAAVLSVILVLALTVPTGGYVLQSIRRHGHWGTRPVKRHAEAGMSAAPES